MSCKRKLTLNLNEGTKPKRKRKKKNFQFSNDSGSDNRTVSNSGQDKQVGLQPSSDTSDDIDINDVHSTVSESESDLTREKMKFGDYVIVELRDVKNLFHYVAKIVPPSPEDSNSDIDEDDMKVVYLVKKFQLQWAATICVS